MKNVIVLGSTGNLGVQTLEVLAKHKDKFNVIGLSAFENEKLLLSQARKLKIKKENVVLVSHDGKRKLNNLARHKNADIIANVLSGICGITPTKIALQANKTVLLGNKESLVAEGKKIMEIVRKKSQKTGRKILLSLDSEHNAITEIIAFKSQKTNKEIKSADIKKIIIPCSGGALFGKTKSQIAKATLKDILAHPKWKMGAKITIESATWINKGMEVIEAHFLFNLPLNKIEVLVHPACLVHGIVEFKDGETLAYISKPDMRNHIENALMRTLFNDTPNIFSKNYHSEIRPFKKNEFKFFRPDHKTFPGIKIVLAAFKKHPDKMKEFLKKEEKLIRMLLSNH